MTDHTAKINVRPIVDQTLSTDLESRFYVLQDKIYSFEQGEEFPSAIDYAILDNQIQSTIDEYPILAEVISKDLICWSLLTTICEKVHNELAHPAIKYLIEANPIALLWKWGEAYEPSTPIKCIASSPTHCTMMPWIAENFSLILNHPKCSNRPPHCELISQYTNGSCHADIIRQFFENYPQGLGQQNKLMRYGLPLNLILSGWEHCDANLFRWMAEKYPAAVPKRDTDGMIPLHMACLRLGSESNSDAVPPPPEAEEHYKEICIFLIDNYPRSIRTKSRHGRCFPIHYLVKRCNRPGVQEVMVKLLREYPESINATNKRKAFPTPNSIPFIQQVGHVLDTERKLKAEVVSLNASSDAFREAASCSKSNIWMVLPIIIETWSKSRCQACQERLESNELEEEILRIRQVHEDADDPANEEESNDDDSDEISYELDGLKESQDDSEPEESDDDDDDDDDDCSYGIDVIVPHDQQE